MKELTSKAGDLARRLHADIGKSVPSDTRAALYAGEASRLRAAAGKLVGVPDIAHLYREAADILEGWSLST